MKVLHKLSQATKETRQLQLDKITDRGKKTKIPINLGKLLVWKKPSKEIRQRNEHKGIFYILGSFS